MAAIFCGLWLAFAVFSYQQYLHGWESVVLLYAIPAVVLMFLLVSLEESSVFMIAVSSSLILATFAAYAFEAVEDYNRFLGEPARISAAERIGVDFDTSTRHEIVRKLRQDGFDAYPPINPAALIAASFKMYVDNDEVLPFGGISNKTVVACNESGRWISYSTDEHGFNNPLGIWASKGLDIAIVGDSFLNGWCVDPANDIASQLRSMYPATLNLANSGNGPLVELASIKEFLEPFQPRFVLWFYFEGNDLNDLVFHEQDNAILMQYVTSDFRQQLVAKQPDIDKKLSEFTNTQLALYDDKSPDPFRSYLRYVLKLTDLRSRIGLTSTRLTESESVLTSFARVLDEAKEYVERWDGELIFVYLPMWERYAKPQYANIHREKVLELVQNHHISLVDLHPTFMEQSDPLSLFPLRLFGHYNELGQEIVATAVLNAIESEKQ